jgi:hypothetical protein
MSAPQDKAPQGEAQPAVPIRLLQRAVGIAHSVIALLFVMTALSLLVIAAKAGWEALAGGLDHAAAFGLIETIGVLTVAIVALQIAQTIVEEEVVREAHVSGPTRVRRFLSRFLVVVVVALTLEGLIATFEALREDPSQLVYAASLLVSVGLLLAGWGVFVKCNRAAEELEPEAMEKAKKEDKKLE